MLRLVDWSSLGPALLALTGVALGWVVTARQKSVDRAAQLAEWQRNRRYDLYVQIMPILLSIETAPGGAWNSVNDPTTRLGSDRAQLRELLNHIGIISPTETLEAVRAVCGDLQEAGLKEERRRQAGLSPDEAPPRVLGSRFAVERRIEAVRANMRKDLGLTDALTTVSPRRPFLWFRRGHRPHEPAPDE
jgi:hypothetical protein